MILRDDVVIRKMKHSDFGLMVKWLNDPLVLEFYEETPFNSDKVSKKYGPRVDGNHYVTPCIVEYKKVSIGYIQFYAIQESELKKYGYSVGQNVYGIDQFIGETQLWGKGIGTSMISMMLNYLSIKKSSSSVILEVKSNNLRAISSYKKCGFKKIKELNNDLILMEWK
ncbi:GNAT family N-acetyltransferase [Psychrobacillus sp. FJAT-51614]|uniref:GNAT family N-acetyltransferase n=2 Tax=Psychrobacillus mangrovi TaxID=3117745 RepID=A0ABU8F774_9BACI